MTQDEKPLEPCPFCGEVPQRNGTDYFRLECSNTRCIATVQVNGNTWADTKRAWNTRVLPKPCAGCAEKDAENIGLLKLTDELRDALSELRIRVLEVYGGPSPLLDAAWEKSRKALAKETWEHE